MGNTSLILALDCACDKAVDWLIQQITGAGLRAMRTFDLRMARAAHGDCPCPHHGSEQCTCQMVVLLVYGSAPHPLSLVAHGSAERTWVSLVDEPRERSDAGLEALIRRVLTAHPANLPVA